MATATLCFIDIQNDGLVAEGLSVTGNADADGIHLKYVKGSKT